MSCSIAAATTSGGGLISTADATGSLDIKSGTTTIVAVTSAGVSVTGTLTASGAATLASPVLSGTVTGTYTLGGTPTLTTPILGTPTSGNLANCTGSARAWVSFSDTPTILESRNISSITDNGVGDYTLNFTAALTTANYAVAGSSGSTNTANQAVCINFGVAAPTTSAVRIQTTNSANVVDRSYNTVIIVV